MKFIEDTQGRLFPVSQIEIIGPERQGVGTRTVHLRGEISSVSVLSYRLADLEEESMGPILPAYPGFEVIWPGDKKGETWGHEPIIAWHYYGKHVPCGAITPSGMIDGADAAILYPSGKVQVADGSVYDRVEDWLAEVQGDLETPKGTVQ